ncbi:hypothetical protein [Natronolimnobius baerhuensis]|uniref:Uncharacterized protein n=1 Tax=Natronolimnobius baerhuensis TaxID=253108 RepID=A0A202E5E0_9EURY|nr:hypothetical protein [Natronolimnobius baerhuensis]OVE83492.1 hypothetical protein B2G88_13690 [Natronolimnobius baerhuensis]
MTESFLHRIAVLTVLFGGFVTYIGSEPANPDLFVLGLLIALGGFLVGFVGLVIEARARW